MRNKVLTIGVLCLSGIVACASPTEPDGKRMTGVLAWDRDPSASASTSVMSVTFADDELLSRISAPDTVKAGVAFNVTVTTVGLNGCWRADGIEVETSTNVAKITPYDFVLQTINGEPIGCFDMLIDLPRTASVTFVQPGEALLKVHGRRVSGGDLLAGEPVVVEKRIVVQ